MFELALIPRKNRIFAEEGLDLICFTLTRARSRERARRAAGERSDWALVKVRSVEDEGFRGRKRNSLSSPIGDLSINLME